MAEPLLLSDDAPPRERHPFVGYAMVLVAATLWAVNGSVSKVILERDVTSERLAQLLGCSPRTVARWDAERIGPPRIKVGKTVLYDLEKVPAWLAGRESRPIGEPN